MPNWSAKSQAGFDTLHPDLQLLCNTVIIYHDCSILFGHRDEDIQNALFADGKSKLRFPESKHNDLPSSAVDLLPYRYGYNPYGSKAELAYGKYFTGYVLGIADILYQEGRMMYKVRAGANWSTKRDKPFARFYDGYHFELYK